MHCLLSYGMRATMGVPPFWSTDWTAMNRYFSASVCGSPYILVNSLVVVIHE